MDFGRASEPNVRTYRTAVYLGRSTHVIDILDSILPRLSRARVSIRIPDASMSPNALIAFPGKKRSTGIIVRTLLPQYAVRHAR